MHRTQIIVALDFPNRSEVEEFIPKLENQVEWVKVGMELYYSEGPSIVEYLQKQGYKIFLDLKLHDIPNTVSRALKVIDTMGVDMVNIHTLGGHEMMAKARDSVQKTKLIGVTILTSHDAQSLSEINLSGTIETNVLNLAKTAEQVNLDGIVCSAMDLEFLTPEIKQSFLYVTPGIRLNSSANDQKRIMTPGQAKNAGSTHLVIGREITQAENVQASIEAMKKDMNG